MCVGFVKHFPGFGKHGRLLDLADGASTRGNAVASSSWCVLPPSRVQRSPSLISRRATCTAECFRTYTSDLTFGLNSLTVPRSVYTTATSCIELKDLALQMFLHQLEATAGVAAQPPRVQALLNSKACRSAIKFGDELSLQVRLQPCSAKYLVSHTVTR